jgi:hypothetical protein
MKYRVASGWFAGALFASAWHGFSQDLLGKEKYIKMVELGWINTPIWFWPLIMGVALLVSFERKS